MKTTYILTIKRATSSIPEKLKDRIMDHPGHGVIAIRPKFTRPPNEKVVEITGRLNTISEMYLFGSETLTHIGHWFNHRVDMTALSIEYPNFLFVLDVMDCNDFSRKRNFFINSYRYGILGLQGSKCLFDASKLVKIEPPYATGLSSLSEHAHRFVDTGLAVRFDVAPQEAEHVNVS